MEFGTGLILLFTGVVIFAFLTPTLIYRILHGGKNIFPHNFSNHKTQIDPDQVDAKDIICL
ncbi:MAG: hypothetical protein LBB10_00380 [Bifidobacteriaceae bacterium]|jgi:hypothetical protein|nr:hypothetical protein [Bifidobacteriaceae bacterium]